MYLKQYYSVIKYVIYQFLTVFLDAIKWTIQHKYFKGKH